ncbi:hypothetical protein [Sphingosinicella sp.]|uniref:hypothetical protein n=1 Tax=Sphingosinicella sp. TaxID=1917971 RepID=UPI00180AA784|nr:hypothetical protein [Sphingosinicella sp.]MBA4758411.1 hypothetical protein [Sphingosinicella sp.]
MLCRLFAAIGNSARLYKIWHTREVLIFMADQATKNRLFSLRGAEKPSANLPFSELCEQWQHNNTLLLEGEGRVETSDLGPTSAGEKILMVQNFAAPSGKSYIPWVDQEIVYPRRSARFLSDCTKLEMQDGETCSHKQEIQFNNLLDNFRYVFALSRSDDVKKIKYLVKISMRHVATIQTRWILFIPIKKTILMDNETGIDFSSPVYTKDGSFHPYSEIHDGIRSITN